MKCTKEKQSTKDPKENLFPPTSKTMRSKNQLNATGLDRSFFQVQPKLKIGRGNDRYEQEADRVADRVMNPPGKQPVDDTIKKGNPAIQGKAGDSDITTGIESRIGNMQGGGQPLPESTRSFFEPRLGHDFSKVKVHADSKAVDTAGELHARAFTTGSDIFFGANEYSPGSSTGRHLLAHELTHVVQNADRQRYINRTPDYDLLRQCITKTYARQLAERGELEENIRMLTNELENMEKNDDLYSSIKTNLDLLIEEWTSFSPPDIDSEYSESESHLSENQNICDNTVTQAPMEESTNLTEQSIKRLRFDQIEERIMFLKNQLNDLNQCDEIYDRLSTQLKVYESELLNRSCGELKSDKIIRIAWTIDDGPQDRTEAMRSSGLGNLGSATFYVQYSKINENWESNIELLKEIQNVGGEIAIHSFSKEKEHEHAAWFPMQKGPSAYKFPYANWSQEEIMYELEGFYNILKEEGIIPRFVRLPGGLYSELIAYAKDEGFNKEGAEKISKGIINGNINFEGFSDVQKEKIEKMQRNYEIMLGKLNELNLLLWRGTANPLEVAALSWQSETSGVPGRHDTTTFNVTHEEKRETDYAKKIAGVFEKKVRALKEGETTSLVILAHANSDADIQAVKEDKLEMEKFAKENNVKIEYHTMSSLFNYITGNDIETFDVNYRLKSNR